MYNGNTQSQTQTQSQQLTSGIINLTNSFTGISPLTVAQHDSNPAGVNDLIADGNWHSVIMSTFMTPQMGAFGIKVFKTNIGGVSGSVTLEISPDEINQPYVISLVNITSIGIASQARSVIPFPVLLIAGHNELRYRITLSGVGTTGYAEIAEVGYL